jgi:very-short-patch-repair endonuclease
MGVEKDRLLSLIEFSQQSARLRGKSACTVAAHGLFSLCEHEIQGLPGIRINGNGTDGEDEVWLAVERLHESAPPDVAGAELRPWVRTTQEPTEEPRLHDAISGSSLIAAGTHCSTESDPPQHKPTVDPETTVKLADHDRQAHVMAQFATYVDTKWRPWAEVEKLRRKTIRLYSQLFTLKQQIEGGLVEAQLELLWAVGVGIWNFDGATVSYPLVGRLVEMSLNPVTAELEIRPRDVDARIEIDWYASVDNPGIPGLEKAAKEFFASATTTFSPFDRGTFEPLLRTAATNLDANGTYWPDEVLPSERTLPKPDDKLKVTDTWLLFARPRTNNVFLQDLDKLKARAEEAESFPPAVAAIVTEPDASNEIVDLPDFRGISGSYHSNRDASGNKVRDVYFPKPFNDEQFHIVQLLDVSDGVVVQGPPGTGKTHTIANVICHYLAEGKRVLVTSMKDPALREVQEKLPDEIRPLAISLLSSEQEGMKQFEHAIHKIASEVQSLDRGGTARAIAHLEESIEFLHGRLAATDYKIGEWAKQNLDRVTLETEQIDPQDAAREVVKSAGQFEWIPDSLGIGAEFAPQFTDPDIVQLREARCALGRDIDYLGASLPQLVEFPDSMTLLEVHQDLSQFEKLKRVVESGGVPALADSTQATLARAQQTLEDTRALQRLRGELVQANCHWATAMRDRLRRGGSDNLTWVLESLGTSLEQAMDRRKEFLERPVTVPAGAEIDADLVAAVSNLAQGRSPFGLKGLFGRSAQKRQLDGIRVLGKPPSTSESWKHVADHLALLNGLRELALRWNALALELQMDLVPGDSPDGGIGAAHGYALYLKVKSVVKAEGELCAATSVVFPSWLHVRELRDNSQRLTELETALQHHLTKNRLANVWAQKERFQKVLEGRTGRVIGDIRRFLADTLGNPGIEDASMQAEWTSLMAELSRILGLGAHLAVVRKGCDKIEASGAPKYAACLRLPVAGTVDHLLPDNWRSAWRLRRLASHLESIDAQDELTTLAKDRNELESDLTRAYRDIVVKRTWLKLAENASPRIRAALQAYLNAVQRIGKGTGKRAVRYRQDARAAASQANPAVPCWIMPHHRVSESLPAELGCFDLVIIDEASQSDLTALPALLRAKKILVVGDDKQVSPEGVGLEEEKIRNLMSRFLGNQVETYRPQLSPERSVYDLFKVVFAKSAIMLKEHFRCVGAIIEYSKREFYNHELRPLRMPKSSERLDPPLIDVLVEDGYRKGDVNLPEARFIVDEIKAIAADPAMRGRSIGVVSLLGDKQALSIWERMTDELGPEVMQRHRVACGDARTFQGKERDIMFLSMVSAPNEVGAPLSRDTFRQRFNVAASRARDRMYLVRSVSAEHLSNADELRRGLIAHFKAPFAQDEMRVEDLRQLCESPFEREMYDELAQRGYWVTPQVKVGQYRIDMVVEGHNDARLAVECDGDRYHGEDRWADDMQRQRTLERAGWVFWRCFASAFIRRRAEILEDLTRALAERGIAPIGAEGAPRSVHTEHRVVCSPTEPTLNRRSEVPVEIHESARASSYDVPPQANTASGDIPLAGARITFLSGDGNVIERARAVAYSGDERVGSPPFSDYLEFAGPAGDDPRRIGEDEISDGIVRIVEIEGPMITKRAFDIYLRGCGIKRMGHELQGTMNKALSRAVRQERVVCTNEAGADGILCSVVRVHGSPSIKLRRRGSRSFEELPPSELQVVAKYLQEQKGCTRGSDEHLREILECFNLKRLTTQVTTALLKVLELDLPHADEFLSGLSAQRD